MLARGSEKYMETVNVSHKRLTLRTSGRTYQHFSTVTSQYRSIEDTRLSRETLKTERNIDNLKTYRCR